MVYDLEKNQLRVQKEVSLPFKYKDRLFDNGFRVDLLVENTIILELKSVEKLQPVHMKQLLTYLKLADKPLELLINFNHALLKDGIIRVVNKL